MQGARLSIEKRPNRPLLDAIGVAAMGVVIFGGLYLLLGGGWVRAEASPAAVSQRNALSATGGILPQDIIVLKPGQDKVIGKTRLTYRGLTDGRRKMNLDVSLLELDPQVAYRHAIGIPSAKARFILADLTFQLLSARPEYVQLRLLKIRSGG
jgi:hypothetical protein